MNKKFLILSFILILILGIIGYIRNNIINKSTLVDPFDDIREIDSMYESIDIEKIPENIKNEHYIFLEEFSNILTSINDNIEYKNIQNIYYSGYRFTYLFVDVSSKKIVSKLLLFYDGSGNLKRVKVEFRDMENNLFLKYFNSCIKMQYLNLAENLINKISNGINDNLNSNWKLGTNFDYEYYSDNNLRIINLYY